MVEMKSEKKIYRHRCRCWALGERIFLFDAYHIGAFSTEPRAHASIDELNNSIFILPDEGKKMFAQI